MPKKKPSQSDEVPAVQLAVRVPKALFDALQAAAAGLNVDLSNLVRLALSEHVGEYVERGRRVAAALADARLAAQPAAAAEQQARVGASVSRGRGSILLDTGAEREGTPEVR
jgi:hypothetical protein